jgi:hypothetical protein
MTEDPVKLYVVVMAILLLVLAFVAYTSYSEAAAFEHSIEMAPGQAKRLKEYAAEVQALCNQLGTKRWKKGELSLIEEASKDNRLPYAKLGPLRIERKRTYKERRFPFEFRRSGRGRTFTREEIARLCRTVESYSQNILRTIEVQLYRVSEPGSPAPGKEDKVVGDLYRGKLIFGMRVVD